MAVPQAAAAEIEKQEDDTEGAVGVALFPRRKQGSSASMPTQRMPVKIDLAALEALYGMPQPAAVRAGHFTYDSQTGVPQARYQTLALYI